MKKLSLSLKTLTILLLPALVTGCGGAGESLSSSSSFSSSSSSSSFKPSTGLVDSSLTLANCLDYEEMYPLKSVGTDEILVVPCVFKGEQEFTETMMDNVKKGFFDSTLHKDDPTSYFSVSEYYHTSSYGNLTIEGEVTPLVSIDMTVEEVTASESYFPGVPAGQFYDSADASLLQKYDTDKDGYIDAIVFVYSSPMDSRSGSFWGWCNSFNTEPNLDKPTPKHHMWLSAETFAGSGYTIDAHTAIHETGHLLGLRDYYPSDNTYVALGGHSMMDYNISDHDPYSKMMLGWAKPTYYDLTDESIITVSLSSFQSTGEFILLKNNWNHTPFDEYLLLEYYTVDGLNEPDSKIQYPSRPLGFTKAGLKIYHVDSRMAEISVSNNVISFVQYVNEIPDTVEENHYYLIGANNNDDSSYTDSSRQGRYKQIALVENKEYNRLQLGEAADDDSLFDVGSTFDSSSSAYFLEGNYNSKESVSLKVDVLSLSSSSLTLSIENTGDTL